MIMNKDNLPIIPVAISGTLIVFIIVCLIYIVNILISSSDSESSPTVNSSGSQEHITHPQAPSEKKKYHNKLDEEAVNNDLEKVIDDQFIIKTKDEIGEWNILIINLKNNPIENALVIYKKENGTYRLVAGPGTSFSYGDLYSKGVIDDIINSSLVKGYVR